MDYTTTQPNDLDAIIHRVRGIKMKWAHRDQEALMMRAVLAGDWEKVAPGAFTEDYPAPMVANRIKVMSKDVAASLAPLPSVNCSASNALSEAAKKFADKRSRIANAYVRGSHLQAHHTDYATSYNTFGLGVYFIEPDLDAKMPRIRVRNGSSTYGTWDSAGRTVWAAEEMCLNSYELVAQFPDAAGVLEEHGKDNGRDVTVVRYSDGQRTVAYLPECSYHVLLTYAAPIPGESQYVLVPLPGEGHSFTGVPRGAYADLVMPQIADHEFRLLQLEAASKAVQAPLAVPMDVTDVPYGPDALIRTQQPQNVRRVATEIPNSAFAASQLVREDLAVGGMSPESRTGNIQASVITGKGIEAASAGYSSQIANAQILIAFGLEQAIGKCFAMDEHLWSNVSKKVQGVDQGAPYLLEYKPSKDVNGVHTVEISYGFLSGMAPNNALIFVLQAQAAGLISRDFAARQLPVGINVSDEFNKIDIETMRNSLMQGMSALAQSLPGMVQNGMDPTAVVRALADVVKGKQKGRPIEDVISEIFAPQPPPPAPGSEQAASDSAAPGSDAGGGAPPSQDGGGAPLTPSGLKPNIATEGPSGRPDLQQFFAGISGGGSGVLQGGVARKNPVNGQ